MRRGCGVFGSRKVQKAAFRSLFEPWNRRFALNCLSTIVILGIAMCVLSTPGRKHSAKAYALRAS